MKKVYVRPGFTCISIEVEKILEGSPGGSLPINDEAGDRDDMTQGHNGAKDWSEN